MHLTLKSLDILTCVFTYITGMGAFGPGSSGEQLGGSDASYTSEQICSKKGGGIGGRQTSDVARPGQATSPSRRPWTCAWVASGHPRARAWGRSVVSVPEERLRSTCALDATDPPLPWIIAAS